MQRREFKKRTAPRDASSLKVGIVVSRFNEDITSQMLAGARSVLKKWRVKERNISIMHTYGSFEVPLACQRLIKKRRVDTVVAIGCIIKGETSHNVYLGHAAAQGLMRVMLDTGIPIGFGIITTNTLAQAKGRASGEHNHGAKAAIAALELALDLKINT